MGLASELKDHETCFLCKALFAEWRGETLYWKCRKFGGQNHIRGHRNHRTLEEDIPKPVTNDCYEPRAGI